MIILDTVHQKWVQQTRLIPKHLLIYLEEESVISLLNSYLNLNFDVIHAATNHRYVDNNDISLVNLGPIASFSKYK